MANKPRGRPFPKGSPGRPKGVPNKVSRNIMEGVRDRVGDDGGKLLDAAMLLAFGTPEQVEAFFGEPVRRDARVMMQAVEWLADRGFGKAPQEVALTGGSDGEPIRVVFGGRYKPPQE